MSQWTITESLAGGGGLGTFAHMDMSLIFWTEITRKTILLNYHFQLSMM